MFPTPQLLEQYLAHSKYLTSSQTAPTVNQRETDKKEQNLNVIYRVLTFQFEMPVIGPCLNHQIGIKMFKGIEQFYQLFHTA